MNTRYFFLPHPCQAQLCYQSQGPDLGSSFDMRFTWWWRNFINLLLVAQGVTKRLVDSSDCSPLIKQKNEIEKTLNQVHNNTARFKCQKIIALAVFVLTYPVRFGRETSDVNSFRASLFLRQLFAHRPLFSTERILVEWPQCRFLPFRRTRIQQTLTQVTNIWLQLIYPVNLAINTYELGWTWKGVIGL